MISEKIPYYFKSLYYMYYIYSVNKLPLFSNIPQNIIDYIYIEMWKQIVVMALTIWQNKNEI